MSSKTLRPTYTRTIHSKPQLHTLSSIPSLIRLLIYLCTYVFKNVTLSIHAYLSFFLFVSSFLSFLTPAEAKCVICPSTDFKEEKLSIPLQGQRQILYPGSQEGSLGEISLYQYTCLNSPDPAFDQIFLPGV